MTHTRPERALTAARGARGRWLDVVVPLGGPLALVAMVAGGTLYEPTVVGANPTQSGETLLLLYAEGVGNAPLSAGLHLLAALGLLLFGGALWDRLRRDQDAQWPAALAAGGAVVAALLMVRWADDALTALVAVEAGDTVTAKLLVASGWESARLLIPGSAAMMLGAAVAGLRGALPRWFSWLSAAGGLGALGTMVATALPTPYLDVAPAGLVALLSLAWTIPAGAVLAVGAARRGG